ncbi:MAG: discoidin domain-containing protein, partial [Vicinamibacterales bacterium]
NVYPTLPDARWLPGLPQDEGHLFPGVVIVLLGILAFAPLGPSRPVVKWRWVYAVVALGALILSLGPEPRAWGHRLPLPPVYNWLLSAVPLFSALRVPARFGMLAILAIDVIAACGATRLMHGLRAAPRVALAVAASMLIVWEGYGGPIVVLRHELRSPDGDAAANEWLASQPPGPLLGLPMLTLGEAFDMHDQYSTFEHRHPTVNGVSRVGTPLVEWLSGSGSPLVVPDLLPDAVPFLRGLGVRYILIRPKAFLDSGIAARLLDALARDPAIRERARLGDVIAMEIEPAPEQAVEEDGLKRLPSQGLTLTASDHTDRASLAIDGNLHTRWLTGRPQNGSEWIAIDFDRPRNLARVDFVMHPRSVMEFPRLVEIVAAGGVAGGPGKVLYRDSILAALGRGWRQSPEQPTISISLPAQVTTRIVIHQRGQASPWFWAIDDLVLWERDQK